MVNHEHARYCTETVGAFDACIHFNLLATISIVGE